MFAALCLLSLAAPAAAPPAAPPAAAYIERYDALMAPASYEASLSMTATREDGSTRTYAMTLQKAGDDRVRVSFSQPRSAVGQEMLRQGDNLWVYMPNLKRAVRLASRESFMGGDFNNADVLRVHWQSDYDAVVVARKDGKVELELKAKVKDASWDRIRLWMTDVDIKASQPVRAEFYAASGKLLRTLQFDDVKSFGEVTRPAKLVMGNALVPSRKSEMSWSAIDVKPIPDKRFGIDDLGR
jgi:outer membrane lipoprotein-sorting protein